MKWAYYNEWEPYCAQWLRNLIAAGHIPAGEVDERDIREVCGDDVKGFAQCHWFAGIAGWGYAARLADISDDEPIWTGSCPCQPLSSAGQRKGHADERHLWPAFYAIIIERRPARIFGEQVAGKDGREWLSGVRADLEDLGYAVGAIGLCAASLGAPHVRQRLWWHANTIGTGLQGSKPHERASIQPQATFSESRDYFVDVRRALDGNFSGLRERDGVSVTVERSVLRAYGNAIVPQVAAEFMRCCP